MLTQRQRCVRFRTLAPPPNWHKQAIWCHEHMKYRPIVLGWGQTHNKTINQIETEALFDLLSLSLSLSRSLSLSLSRPFSRWTWVSQCLVKQKMMEVVVTTGAIGRAKLHSNHHHQQTNTQFFTGQMPFLSSNQQHQSTEGKLCDLVSVEIIFSTLISVLRGVFLGNHLASNDN